MAASGRTVDHSGVVIPGETPKSGGLDRKRVVVFDSPDITATVGRPGMLDERVPTHEIVRERAVRSDVLAQILAGMGAPAGIPASLAPPTGTLATDPDTSLVIFSLRPEMVASGTVHRHLESGRLVQIEGSQDDDVKEWLERECEPVPLPSSDETSSTIRDILARLQREGRAVVVFNVSTYDPDDQTHRFTPGSVDPFSVRANRLMAELETLATEFEVSVVDVDGAIAELGAADHVPRAGDFSSEAADFITEDVGFLIDQSGVLGTSVQAPVMRIEVPAYDRRTTYGTLARWHVDPGQSVRQGDPLFDVRFDGLVYRVKDQSSEESDRKAARRADRRRANLRAAIVLQVVAGGGGHVAALAIPAGERVKVGDTAAVITTTVGQDPDYDSSTPRFRLGMRVKSQ